MAEHMTIETTSWLLFVDQVAAPLRLETPERMRFGLAASLTIVRHVWGDLIMFRAAERLICTHAFTIDELCDVRDNPALKSWFATWLNAHAPYRASPAPHLSEIVKPAWSHSPGEGEARG